VDVTLRRRFRELRFGHTCGIRINHLPETLDSRARRAREYS
jgi:hypothetical protein